MLTPDDFKLLRRFIASSQALMERYAADSETSRALLGRQRIFQEVVAEWLEELSERIDRIERLLLLERTGGVGSSEAQETRAQLSSEVKSIKRQIIKRVRKLSLLQEQAAVYASGDVPIRLVMQIADEQEIIQSLQSKLKGSKGGGG